MGKYAPIILFSISCMILFVRKYWIFLGSFIGATFLNSGLNLWLKSVIREPRPGYYKSSISGDKFGMPSGHAQCVAFSAMFMWLVLKSPSWMCVFLAIGATTAINRVIHKYHTLSQLGAGYVIGAVFGAFTWMITRHFITGNLRSVRNNRCFFDFGF